jgi:hypothetical protein
MRSTSRFKALTSAYLKLNMNFSLDGNGGSCFGDSGSPKLIHGTNTAVAITTGGDPICRANSYNSRLDTSEARAFYGQYLALPLMDPLDRPASAACGDYLFALDPSVGAVCATIARTMVSQSARSTP